jgi:transcriptional regulator with XRE-family HTH domain
MLKIIDVVDCPFLLLSEMKRKKITQKILSEKSGVGANWISKFINSKIDNPTFCTINKVVKVVNDA